MIKLDQDPRVFMAQRAISSGFQACCSSIAAPWTRFGSACASVGPTRPRTAASLAPPAAVSPTPAAAQEQFVQALRDVVVLAIMMEKAVLVEQLEDVLAVPRRGYDPVGANRLYDEQRAVRPAQRPAGGQNGRASGAGTCLAKGVPLASSCRTWTTSNTTWRWGSNTFASGTTWPSCATIGRRRARRCADRVERG